MNIKGLENKLKMISDQIKQYEGVKVVAELVRDGKEKPTHDLFVATVDMVEIILNNLRKEMKECKTEIQSLKAYRSSGGYPFGN